jgi:hypothetical protein
MRVIALGLVLLLGPLCAQTVYPPGGYGGGSKGAPGTIPNEPLATFRGTVQGSSPKNLVVKTETDTVDFECSRKTTYLRKGKAVKGNEIKVGDLVAVEARHTIDGKVLAVNVILDPPPEPKAKHPSDFDANR